jgi:hypothetical protein
VLIITVTGIQEANTIWGSFCKKNSQGKIGFSYMEVVVSG